jgi:hypothetical protein
MVRPSSRHSALPRVLLAAAFLSLTLGAIGPLSHPAPVAASTASTMEAQIVGWVNDARVKRGLVPLRQLPALVDLAGDRAATLASTGVLAHPSCLSCVFNSRGIQWYSIGEVIAWTSYPWGSQAASSIFNSWKNSREPLGHADEQPLQLHRDGHRLPQLRQPDLAAGELSESKDQTRPWARMGSSARSGSTVSWSWAGGDTRLQTHTSGFKNFDVQYRVGSGTWSTIRSGTTATSLSLSGRAGGHYYGLRVRSRDNRGYVSAWTAELRVWVP